jgi:Flp pilus assembly protein TadG
MLRFFRRLRQSRAGNASVEFALVASFVLLPFGLGATDFLSIISAQAQLNTALQSLYYFAYTNPTAANNTTYAGYIISLINQSSIYQISLPATMSSGAANASLSYGCFTPPSTTITYQSTTCPTGQTQQTLVSYQVSTTVALPFPLPGFANPMPLTATGKVQVE